MKPIKIIVAGDIMPSDNNFTLFKKGDVESLFGNTIVKIFNEADYSIANLEGALTDSIIAQQKDGPGIKAPKETINGIKNLPIKALTLANNHITDYLQKGCIDTIDTLEKEGINYLGLINKGEEEILSSGKFLSISIKGYHICFYNVSETFFNRPTKEMMGANVYDEWIVCNEIQELKKVHDFVVVIYHGGAEYFPYPTPQTRTRFHRMAKSGADFITAQHTHCIGCEEWYNNSYLLYGQGNFLFARQKMFPRLTKQGLVTEINISDNGFSIKNHIVKIVDGVLEYDTAQDFNAFKERSLKLDDEDFVVSEYQKLKVSELKNKYLWAYKGDYPLSSLFKRLIPRYNNSPETTYNIRQILRNFNVLQGDRRREDMYYVWKYLLDNYRGNGE